MEMIISTVGWLLKKVGEKVVDTVLGKITQSALSKVGIFDAKCERCNTVQSAVVIPENKQFTLECPKCGNAETIFIESVEKLIVRSIKQAIITIDTANVLMNSVNMPQLSSSTPLLADSTNQFQQLPANAIQTSPADEFQSLYGIIERKIVERAIREAIDSVKRNYYKFNLSYSYSIKEYSIFEIRLLVTQQVEAMDLICPEIWIVPDSRKEIAKINAAIQQSVDESLKEIGLSLGKIIIRVFDERLPKK